MIAGIPINERLIKKLEAKLNSGTLRTIQLNCLPGRSLSRLDLSDLSLTGELVPAEFLGKLFNHQRKYSFDISFDSLDLNLIDDDEQKALGVLSKRLNHLAIQNKEDLQEYGYESFGFGFPIVVFRPEKAPSKTVRAPLFIWRLSIQKNLRSSNSWKITRSLDQEIQFNEVLRSFLSDVNDLAVSDFYEDELDDGILDEDEIISNTIRFIQSFSKKSSESELGLNFKNRLSEGPEKLPAREKLDSIAETIPKVYWSGVFGRFIQRNEAIKRELKEHLGDLIINEDDDGLKQEHVVESFSHSETGVEADPSQLGILNYLQKNDHLIIQGPPGTGKSQTITGILLNAMEQGKKTLVVCEKKTAMEVLKNNLNEISPAIGELIGVIDDISRDRKEIVNSVRDRYERGIPLEYLRGGSLPTVSNRLEIIQERIEEIHNKKIFLHKESICEDGDTKLTWSQTVGRFLKAKMHNDGNKIVDELERSNYPINEISLDEADKSLKILEDKSTRVSHEDYLSFLTDEAVVNHNPIALKKELETLLERNVDELSQFIANYEQHIEDTRSRLYNRIDEQIKAIDQTTEELGKLLKLLGSQHLFKKDNWRYSIANLLSHVSSKVKKNVEAFDKIPELLDELKEKSISLDLSVFKESVPQSIPELRLWKDRNEQKLREQIASLDEVKRRLLNKLSEESVLKVKMDDEVLSLFKERVKQFRRFAETHDVKNELRSQYIADLLEAKKALTCFLQVSEAFSKAERDGFLEHFSWQQLYRQQASHLQKLTKLFQEHKVSDWHILFDQYYYNELLGEKIDVSRSGGYDAELKSLEEERKKLRKEIAQRIPRHWTVLQANLQPRIPIRTLYNKRGSKGKRRNSLRKIIHWDFDTFTTFFPVVMVNPSVCASIIPLKPELFDLVVFDEASQLKVEESISTLIRGKRKVVSGDKHQMPPSYYFVSNSSDNLNVEDEIEEEESEELFIEKETTNELADSESLLEFAELCEFKQAKLDFHYRSRHPLLIQFSNAAFYKGRLYPLPERISNPPIQFFRIDGDYAHNQNKQEAEAVIAALKEIQTNKDGSLPSIGIATFNIQQRNLIWDLIKREVQLDEDFQKRYEELEQNGLFIKNLENIQGDERDIILISTTFGRRDDGRFTANYGPLTRRGIGRRLLNVIITRAKKKLFVFTSIPEDRCLNYKVELNGEAKSERGYLHAYLCYAKAVSEGDAESIKSILDFLGDSQGRDFSLNFTTESPFEESSLASSFNTFP